jgi:hypothetical protein
MSRIDVNTLVLAFEKRIELLERNPPDKVPMAVVIKLLENAIEDVLRENVLHTIKKEFDDCVRKEFKIIHKKFINKTLKNILADERFRSEIENKIKLSLMMNIK